MNIYLRKTDKQINKEEQDIIVINNEGVGNDIFNKITIKTIELKQKDNIKLIQFKHRINNNKMKINYG